MQQCPDVLELPGSVGPAFAGLLLAEHGFSVVKWSDQHDTLSGAGLDTAMLAWLHGSKRIEPRDPAELLLPLTWQRWHQQAPLVILDGMPPDQLACRGIAPDLLARERDIVWVSLEPLEPSPHQHSFAVETTIGLWIAFKALALVHHGETGQTTLNVAPLLARLGEPGRASRS
jgi:hypothetical protein